MSDRRWQLIGIIAAVTAASLAYRALYAGGLEQTSAMFVGLPAFLALVLVMVGRPRTSMGVAMMATTLALLISGIILSEGIICILMAAPLFYLVTFLVVFAVERARAKDRGGRAELALLLPLAAFSLEGVLPGLELSRDERVDVEIMLPMSAIEFEAALTEPPVFADPVPVALRPGFPRPVRATGRGLEVGDRRQVDFAAGGEVAAMSFEVVDRGDGRVRMVLERDETPIAHWLTWKETRITWAEEGEGTLVRLTLDFQRELDPFWYFAPLERGAVRIAGKYLLESFANALPLENRTRSTLHSAIPDRQN